MKPWAIRSSKVVFNNPWMRVRQDLVELPNGHVMDDYFLYLSYSAAQVVPVTLDGKFLLVRQYKHGLGEITLEFPAGIIDAGEQPVDTARRELEEETGYQAADFELLAVTATDPTKATGRAYLFLARNAELTGTTNREPSEEIEVVLLTRPELEQLIVSGGMPATSSIAAAYLAFKALDSAATQSDTE